jgi:type IV pilus assembly protein PilW
MTPLAGGRTTLSLPLVHRQAGLTMIELMIAMALGLLLMLVATSLLLSSKAGYVAEDQIVQIHETGRYATEVLARAIRQTGYEHMDGERVAIMATADLTANVAGLDAMTLKKTGAGLTSATSGDAVNGSDVLAVRFFGDDAGDGNNGTILNCAGLAVSAMTATGSAEQDRGWSIFYVAKDSAGEPELRCKYQTKSGWNADAIARGVESFQVLYGVDVHGGGTPDQFINARDVDALDDRLALNGNNAVERLADLNRKTYWKKVRSIRFSLLVRGSQKARDDALTDEYHLFGPVYSRMQADSDKGVFITEQSLPVATRDYIRKIFTQTIQLRNDAAGSDA